MKKMLSILLLFLPSIVLSQYRPSVSARLARIDSIMVIKGNDTSWVYSDGNGNLVLKDSTGAYLLSELVGGGGGGEVNTASNLLGTGVGVFKNKSVFDLRFKRLIPEWGILITDRTDSVGIKVDTSVVATKSYSDAQLAAARLADTARAIVREGLLVPKTTTITVAATAPLSSSAGAQDFSANRTWTITADTSAGNTHLATQAYVLLHQGTGGGLTEGEVNALIAAMLADSTVRKDTTGSGAIAALTHIVALKWNATYDTVQVFDATISNRPDTVFTLTYVKFLIAGKQAAGTYLVPNDSTIQRTYSNSLYLKNADSTRLKVIISDSAAAIRASIALFRGQDTTRLKVIIADTASALRTSIGTFRGVDTTRVKVIIADTAAVLRTLIGSKQDSTDHETRTHTAATYTPLGQIGKRLADSTGIGAGKFWFMDGTKWVLKDTSIVGGAGGGGVSDATMRQAIHDSLGTLPGYYATTGHILKDSSGAVTNGPRARGGVTDSILVASDSSGTNRPYYLTPRQAASAYQPLDADLTTIAGLTATTDNFIISVASAWASRTPAQARVTLSVPVFSSTDPGATNLFTKWDDTGNQMTFESASSHLSAIGGAASATTITVAGTANEIASSAGAQDLSTNRTWTLSLPADINLGSKTSLQIPNAAAPTVDAFGEIAGDNNLWASGRGAPIFYDGTAPVGLLGALVSDAPSNGQVPKWNTGGTITWEADNTTAGSGGGTPIDSTTYHIGQIIAGGLKPTIMPSSDIDTFYVVPTLPADTAGYGTAKATPAGKVMVPQPDGDIGIGTLTYTAQIYTANALWSKPAGLVAIKVICIGGGGGGASVTAADESGGGGGGGGGTVSIFAASALQATESVYVATAAAALATGASSWFGGISQTGGQLDIALGGSPGAVSGNTTTVGVGGAGGAGGLPTTGDLNIKGQNGFTGVCYSTTRSCGGPGGGAALGYGGGATEGCNAVGEAVAAAAYGGGGGGAGTGDGTDFAGGTGGPGLVIVYEYRIL